MNTGVYTITNLINGKIYVGSTTTTFRKRELDHFSYLRRDCHSNKHLQNSFNKYKEDNFKFEILEECNSDLCISQEQYWINMLNTSDSNYGYNLISPIIGLRSYKRSEELVKRIANSLRGFKHTTQTRNRMSLSKLGNTNMKGYKIPEITKKKMSIAQSGENNHFYGKKHSEETKRKISESKRRKV